jgi:hypothetical protein
MAILNDLITCHYLSNACPRLKRAGCRSEAQEGSFNIIIFLYKTGDFHCFTSPNIAIPLSFHCLPLLKQWGGGTMFTENSMPVCHGCTAGDDYLTASSHYSALLSSHYLSTQKAAILSNLTT